MGHCCNFFISRIPPLPTMLSQQLKMLLFASFVGGGILNSSVEGKQHWLMCGESFDVGLLHTDDTIRFASHNDYTGFTDAPAKKKCMNLFKVIHAKDPPINIPQQIHSTQAGLGESKKIFLGLKSITS